MSGIDWQAVITGQGEDIDRLRADVDALTDTVTAQQATIEHLLAAVQRLSR